MISRNSIVNHDASSPHAGQPGLVLALRQVLHNAPLPGWPAQMRLLPLPRAIALDDAPRRESAVLLALFERQGELRLLLTQRTERTRHHKGQIALPGGARDPADASLWATALREAEEEVGLPAHAVAPLGALTPLFVASSRFDIHPFIGWVSAPPDEWVIAPAEVAAVIELPLHVLRDPATLVEATWPLADRTARVPFYRYGQHQVWGATAMILSELQVLLAGLDTNDRGAR